MKKHKFSWKAGGGEFRQYDPNVIGTELNRIRDERGGLTPADVVDAARNESSPLHPLLPWDDTEAARIGREAIASRIMRSVIITIVKGGSSTQTRAFVSKSIGNRERTYAFVETELASEEGRAMLIRQAWLQLKAWRARFAELDELAKIFDTIDRVHEERKAG